MIDSLTIVAIAGGWQDKKFLYLFSAYVGLYNKHTPGSDNPMSGGRKCCPILIWVCHQQRMYLSTGQLEMIAQHKRVLTKGAGYFHIQDDQRCRFSIKATGFIIVFVLIVRHARSIPLWLLYPHVFHTRRTLLLFLKSIGHRPHMLWLFMCNNQVYYNIW